MVKKQKETWLLRFRDHLLRQRFFRPRQRIFVACSGGPDSVALFHALRVLAPQCRIKLGLLHFNHQLRPRTSKRDEVFVRRLARRYRVPFFCGSGDVASEAKRKNASIEERAREMRYDFFMKVARRFRGSGVVFAHTRNDQAETVLMRALQGTGLRGLQGIREISRVNGIPFIRPFLPFTKRELLRFLREGKFPYCKDETNGSLRFIRNRIRLKLIPQLERDFNPRVVEALARIPAIAAVESSLVEELESKAWEKGLRKLSARAVELKRAFFLQCHPAVQYRLLERALKALDPQSGLSFEAWERLRCGLKKIRHRVSLPRDIDFEVTPGKVTVYKKYPAV